MEMKYEAARLESRPEQFATLAQALGHIAGSAVDQTRPWVRSNSPRVFQSFLIVSGRKLDEKSFAGPPVLPDPVDQALFDMWSFKDSTTLPTTSTQEISHGGR